MAGKKSAVDWGDRDQLRAVLRAVIAEAGDRCSLGELTQGVLDRLEAMNGAAEEWVGRMQRGALADFLYNQLDLEMKRQKVVFALPKSGRNVTLNPRQGIRVVGEERYQQVLILAMTKPEYLAWRAREIAEIRVHSDRMQVIRAIDAFWDEYPDAADLGDLFRLAGMDSSRLRLPESA
jgi:hypothetical protein